jgi:hypothetical protein
VHSSNHADRTATGGIIFSWFAFFVAHIEQINAFMQFFALLFAIAASVCAIRYHTRKQK